MREVPPSGDCPTSRSGLRCVGPLVPPGQGHSRSSLQAQSVGGEWAPGRTALPCGLRPAWQRGPAGWSTQRERPVLCALQLQARGVYHLQRHPEPRVCSTPRLEGHSDADGHDSGDFRLTGCDSFVSPVCGDTSAIHVRLIFLGDNCRLSRVT